MKKIISFIICTILCSAFTITASAYLEEQETYNIIVNFNSVSSDFDSVPSFAKNENAGNEIGNTPFYFSFAQSRRNGDNAVTWYYTVHFNIDDFVYDADTQTISKSDGSYFDFYYTSVAVEDADPEHSSGTGYGNVHVKYIKFNGSFDAERFKKNTNMHIKNLEPFDPHMPPEVFTYSVDKNNFTLQNGEQGAFNVTISYTDEYIAWVQQVRDKLLPEFNGSYNFLLYVSKTRAVDIESLKQSLQDMSYVKLTYNDYYTAEEENYTAYTWHNDDDYMLNRGADIAFTFDPMKQQSITIPCLSENIQGEQSHVDGFVTVIGTYCEGKLNPDTFTLSWIEKTLNGLYDSDFYDTVSGAAELVNNQPAPNNRYLTYLIPDINNILNKNKLLMRQFYVPYNLIGTFKCDLYNANCLYKLQTVNGQDYLTPSDTSHRISPEYQQHSSMEDKSTWLNPEDARKYRNDWRKSQQYGDDFDFNGETFKDVFSKEGDFFKFIGSALSVFPSYVMTIFVAFLVCMLVIVLLKFIL